MILDARTIADSSVLTADICIIGSVPAGITLAKQFDGQPYKVILLEAGTFKRDSKGQDCYKGEDVGLHYDDLDHSRSRYFGGSSNCWGGFCRPLDKQDFEVRDWMPNSGWPLTRTDLMPYYRRAHSLLELGPFEYGPEIWQEWINKRDARMLQFPDKRMMSVISQLSPPTRFGSKYRNDIEQSKNVITYLNSSVVDIETPGNGSQVSGVTVCSWPKSEFRVVAKVYILAAGGIDTPRLLLASNKHQSAGVGNQNDLVGRYFMDHPRLRQGKITFKQPKINSPYYNLHYTYPGGMQAQGVKIAAYFGLSAKVQEQERIANTRCYVVSRFVADHERSYAAAGRLRQAFLGAEPFRDLSKAEIINIITQAPNVLLLAAGMKLKVPFLARGFALETIVEPTPLRDSRVTLGTDCDRFGTPRVKVNWQLGEIEKRTMKRTQEILNEQLLATGSGSVTVGAPDEGDAWPSNLKGCWHHMGTTRMHNDPKNGVVDKDCKVHGMQNLFIAGSSLFPTSGSDMPTITIVALAIRLAEHIESLDLSKI